MFASWFKRVFGIGAAIVATLALAVAAVGAGVWIFQAVDNPRADMAKRLADFEQICAQRPQTGPWTKYQDQSIPAPPPGFVLKQPKLTPSEEAELDLLERQVAASQNGTSIPPREELRLLREISALRRMEDLDAACAEFNAAKKSN